MLILKTIFSFYTNKLLKENFAFRGGTALHKCYLQNNLRFSEDIDLNQCSNFKLDQTKEEIKKIFQDIGFPLEKHFRDTPYGIQLSGHYNSKITERKDKLKIDINCNEHFTLFGFKTKKLHIQNPYMDENIEVLTYDLNELIGQKLCALMQRTKGRDLMDIYYASQHPDFNIKKTAKATYTHAVYTPAYSSGGHEKADKARTFYEPITFSEKYFRNKLNEHENNPQFTNDIKRYLNKGIDYNQKEAFVWAKDSLIKKVMQEIILLREQIAKKNSEIIQGNSQKM